MLRSDGRLLAYLATDLHPERGAEVRAELAAAGDSLATVGQALIRAKVLTPQEFLVCRAAIDGCRRQCARCRRPFVAFASLATKRRRCVCGHANLVAPQKATDPPNPFSTHPDRSSRLRRHRTTRPARSARSARAPGPGPGVPGDLPDEVGGYPILGRVGEGGMGDIFRARDPAGRVVALKVLRAGTSRDAEERFRREAQALARLRHPAIVQVHDVGIDERGRHFFTMDYVEGSELTDVVERLERSELLELVAQVADGLHYAHERGVIHRDVKPQNILVGADGRPRIADFGLARVADHSTLSADGELIGTPLFMAPEQVRGDPGAIGRGTDVYALGVLLYEALTGELPIEATSFFDLKQKVLAHVPAPPSSHRPDLGPSIDRVVLKALEKRPEDRYATAAALAADLRRVAAGEVVTARPVSALLRGARAAAGAARSPWAAAALAVVLVAAAVGVWAHAAQRRQQLAEAKRAALVARQDRCRERLNQALEALLEARRAVAAGDVASARTTLARAREAATAAGALGRALGADAPPGFSDELRGFGPGAQRVSAACLARGDPEERAAAQRTYAELVESATRPDPADLLALARLTLEAGQPDAAIASLNDALALAASPPEAYLVRAEAHRAAGRPHFALLDFERALEQPLADAGRVRALCGRALAHLTTGAVELARQAVAEAEAVGAPEPLLWEARAGLRSADGQPGLAVRELDIAAREFPADAGLRRAAGAAWARVGNLDRALAELDRAASTTRDPIARLARARLRDLVGDALGADADLTAVRSSQGLPEASRRLAALVSARVRRTRGDPAGAVRTATALLEDLAGPGQDAGLRRVALLERAEAALAAEAFEAADRDFSTLLEADPTHPRALVGLARVAASRGDQALARARLRRLTAQGADDPRALALRAEVAPDAERAAAQGAALASQLGRVEAFVGPTVEVGDPLDDALCTLVLGRRRLDRAQGSPDGVAEATALLERAHRLAPWFVPARVALAQALGQARRPREALELLSSGTSAGFPGAGALRGQLLAAAGQPAAAVEAFSDALAAIEAAGDPLPPSRRGEAARLLLARARAHLALDREDQAREDSSRAIELDGALLEAFELRAGLTQGAAAAADLERCELLRSGFAAVYQQARRDAWLQGFQKGGNHSLGIRKLAPAFEVVSRDRSPAQRADLHYLRAYMRMRALYIPDALVDLAAVIELAPRPSFRRVVDEFLPLRGAGGGLAPNLDAILEQAARSRGQQAEVDPDLLVGFLAFVELETRAEPDEPRRRAGLEGLARFLARRPGHSGALLLRAALLLGDGQLAEAIAAVTAALEAPEPLAFAHYLQARVRVAQRDPDGAFHSLGAALSQGFDVHTRYESDPALGRVRSDPRYETLVGVAKGAAYLRQIDRAEELALARSRGREEVYELARRAATTGLELVRPWVEAGDAGARSTAARLFLARARQHYRLGGGRAARRDVCAALEASPAVLADWRQVVEAATALAPLDPDAFADLGPARGEGFPTPGLAPALATVLRAITAGDPPGDARQAALEALQAAAERPGSADLRLLVAILRQAGGEDVDAGRAHPEGALDAVGQWLRARRSAARGEVDEALRSLRRARRAGLVGPVGRDPAFAAFRGDARFEALFPQLPTPAGLRWSDE